MNKSNFVVYIKQSPDFIEGGFDPRNVRDYTLLMKQCRGSFRIHEGAAPSDDSERAREGSWNGK